MTHVSTLSGTRALIVTSFLALSALIAGPVAWAALARADGAVVAVAVVRTALPVEAVSHAAGGIVDRILVSDGDVVEPGQALATLDSSKALAEVASLSAQRRSALVVQARLVAEQDGLPAMIVPAAVAFDASANPALGDEIAGQMALFASRRAEALAAHQQGQLAATWAKRKIAALRTRAALVRSELDLLEQDQTAQEALVSQGMTSRRAVRDSARAVLRLQDRLADINGQIGDIQAQGDLRAAALALQDSQRQKDTATQLQQVRARLAELAPRLDAAQQALAASTLRAHVAGRVQLSPQAAPGSVVRPAEPMMLIVPDGAGQRLVAQVPASAINRVALGQTVRVQRHPVDGLTSIRAGIVDNIAPLANAGNGAPVFAVTVLPDAADPGAFDGLHPGQTVTVFLHTKARPVADYLLEPFARFFDRALRES